MPQYKIAHMREQGQNIIIIPLERSYGSKSNSAQNEVKNALQACAVSAGLAGTVVTVWERGDGRMGFLAPPQWRSYFSSMSLSDVYASINKTLTCR